MENHGRVGLPDYLVPDKNVRIRHQDKWRRGVCLSLYKLYNKLWPWRTADSDGELGEESKRMDRL
ncbi:MAG: hypothetical protein ACYCUV_13095 [Phycisphaerae bacterium]